MKEFPKDTDALSALLGGQVDAYFADTPPAAYYTIQHPDQFERRGSRRCSPSRPGSASRRTRPASTPAVVAALQSMIADGTYAAILKKYNVEDGAVTADRREVVTSIEPGG